jgi:hypothetical protein
MPEDDSLKPATKGDVAALERNLKGDITALKGDMVALENRLVEVVRDVQTEILRGFERYAASCRRTFPMSTHPRTGALKSSSSGCTKSRRSSF